MSGYKLIVLKDMLLELGEDKTKEILSSFSCPKGPDVENFLHEKAIIFENQSYATSYLLFASYKGMQQLAGYFTLAHKQFTISDRAVRQRTPGGRTTGISKTMLKKIRKFGTYDELVGVYTIPAPLIGQLGRNFASGDGKQKLITGDELLKIACDKVWETQRLFSGRIVYLECEDIPVLVNFYEDNGFVVFGKRMLDPDEKDDLQGKYLLQMLKDLKAANEKPPIQ